MESSSSGSHRPNDLTGLLISPVEEDYLTVQELFLAEGWTLIRRYSLEEALTVLRRKLIPVVISERNLPTGSWKDVVEVANLLPQPPLIIVASIHADDDLWVDALNGGAHDVLRRPFDRSELARTLKSAWGRYQQTSYFLHEMHRTAGGQGMSRRCRQFPVSIHLEYKLHTRGKTVKRGRGRTVSLSSKIVLFETETVPPADSRIELSIEWPVVLNDGVGLRLCISGSVIETDANCVSVQVLHYVFRTRSMVSRRPLMAVEAKTQLSARQKFG